MTFIFQDGCIDFVMGQTQQFDIIGVFGSFAATHILCWNIAVEYLCTLSLY